MTIDDVKTGEIFNIENTPSYPKMKLESGYIDMRDEIVNTTGETVKGKTVELMTVSGIARQFNEAEGDILSWINEIKSKFLK